MEHAKTSCPSCGNTQFTEHLNLKDWFLTTEVFATQKCDSCSLVITTPAPDLNDLSRYYKSEEYISHTESKGLVSVIYKAVQRYTLSSKFRLVKRKSNCNNILDYGAGKGDFLKFCQDKSLTVSGYEPDSDARKVALEKNGLSLVSDPVGLGSNLFDAITMWHVLEHIPNPAEVVSTLTDRLNDNGRIIIALPNYSSFDAQFYGKYWAAYDVPRHLTHFEPESFKHFAKNVGLEVESHHPMWFDSTYVSLLSEGFLRKFNSGPNQLLGAIRSLIVGLVSNTYSFFNTKRCSSVIYICKRAK